MTNIFKTKAAKVLALMLAVLLLTGCFVSCTEDTSPEQTQPISGQSTQKAPEDTEKHEDTTDQGTQSTDDSQSDPGTSSPSFDFASVPEYTDLAFVTVNGNVPYFSEEEYVREAFERYSPLDSLGRCGVVYANVCKETMPTEERGSIGMVKPSGWQTVKYDSVSGKYLYNRCHLIGWQLTAEDANTKNLITGTRYLNIEGMLPFENMVADYLKEEEENHVLYRVTPVFIGEELVARGVLMEAYSVEDEGDGIEFCVYCYNVQPGIVIDYTNGDSGLSTDPAPTPETTPEQKPSPADVEFVLNTSSKKFHYPDCSAVKKMSDSNKQIFIGTRNELTAKGYDPCGICKP